MVNNIMEHNWELKTEIIVNPEDILKYLHLGINLPIIPEFYKYIRGDLQSYNAKAILLRKNIDRTNFEEKTDNISGISLIYDDGSNILFFGFFGVYDHNPKAIDIMIKKIIEYARLNNFKIIRGPINVPTMIYGWGFMVEGSKKDLYIGSPINPPIYQECFFKNGFKIKYQEDSYEMPALRFDPHKHPELIRMGINKGNYKENPFDTGDYEYEYINPGKEGMYNCLEEFSDLYEKYMPSSSHITPKTKHNIENLIDFIFKYGESWMMWIVRHKKTGQMVANGYIIPDIFSRNKRGGLNSISFHAWVVHPDHRRKQLAIFMYGFTAIQERNRKNHNFITKGYWPVAADNIANVNAGKKFGGIKARSHIILEYNI